MQHDVCTLNKALRNFKAAIQGTSLEKAREFDRRTGFHAAANVLTAAVIDVARVDESTCPEEMKHFISTYANVAETIDIKGVDEMVR